MKLQYNPEYPTVDDLRTKAKKRIPRFAFEYLDGGCNEDVNLHRNTADIRKVELKPYYLSKHNKSDMSTELFGHVYDAPFGIAPVGLQGLMWPKAPEILAKAACEHNIPFCLSTVTTSSIETIGKLTEGKAWFQLYHPAEDKLRDDILKRAEASGYQVLVIVCDVPTFGYRPRDIRNGLAMPPKMTLRNILQICAKPNWAFNTLLAGQPNFETLRPYMPKGLNLKELGQFMADTFAGRVNDDKIAQAVAGMLRHLRVRQAIARARDASVVRHTRWNGHSQGPGPRISRERAVCSGVVLAGCEPCAMVPASAVIFGPSAASTIGISPSGVVMAPRAPLPARCARARRP